MNKKILVVDDEPEICRIMKGFLSMRGFDVQAAPRAEEALELIDKDKFDLLILDKKMPGIGGLAVYWHLEKIGKHIPTIVITGSRRMSGYDDESEKAGYDGMFFKPVDLSELLKKIREILE